MTTRTATDILAERLQASLALSEANAAHHRAQASANGAHIALMAVEDGSPGDLSEARAANDEARARLAEAEVKVETLEVALTRLDEELSRCDREVQQ